MEPSSADAPVLLAREGHAAHVVLNRPRAINALTHDMVRTVAGALAEWAEDPSVRTVVLTGAGERGLCAGADVTAFWRDARAGGTESAAFWRDEYRLNADIADYPKAYVAIMDGIVLGGGVGLSAHSRHRVVTERSRVGMPETTIGFLPDVGGTHLLAHAPGETGTHLGLTGGSMDAGDALALGFADHHVPSDRVGELLRSLATLDAAEAIAAVATPAPPSPLLDARSWIDPAYAGDDPVAIVARLRATGLPDALAAADLVEARSPTSIAVTLRALRTAADLSLVEALDLEYRLALQLHAGHDFVEGIRAQVVDKDRAPRWSPATLAEVDPDEVAAWFDPAAG